MTRALGDARAGLISVAQDISKSVARARPKGTAGASYSWRRRRSKGGVKFNTWGINRFAMKRPFAAVIIYILRRTKAAR